MASLFTLLRAVVYSSVFIAFLLVIVPSRLVSDVGLTRPPRDLLGFAGVAAVVAGAILALSSILTFVFVGRGTPAPFDPPRRLVERGPYRFVRNPMYLGAGLALGGAALVYRSMPLLAYLVALGLIIQAVVVWYEEPVLGRKFGPDYDDYRRRVHRWWPRWPNPSRNNVHRAGNTR